MSKVLIIDDSDPAITYTGNWATLESVESLGNQIRQYNSTAHRSNAAGDQLSYTFEGTSITVYGDLYAPASQGFPNPTFSIDGQMPIDFDSTIVGLDPNANSLYMSGILTKGIHTLAISSGTLTNTAAIYIDFFTVDTSSDSASGNIIVDDRDTSIIYVGNWRDLGSQGGFNLTTTGDPVDVAGGTATFHFNGTSITIYGTTALSSGANTTAAVMFTVDGGTSSQFNAPQNSGVIQHNPLFHVAGLSNTHEHTIVMTSLNTNEWLLDYIVYTTWNSSIAGGGGGSSVTGPEIGASGGGDGGGGPNVGAIAGGVVAGAVALLAIAGITFILTRSRKRKPNEKFNDKSVTAGTGSHFGPSPFTPPATGPHVHANPLPSKLYGSNNFSDSALTGGAGGRVGRALHNSAEYSSYLGTSPWSSSLPRGQYSDGESRQVLTPAVSGPRYGYQSLGNPLYPRFGPGAGGRITSMYQKDSREDYVQETGQPFGQKAEFHGHSAAPIIPAVTTRRGPRPPPSSVPMIEEDSGIRIPTRAPPAYTPD